MNRRKFLGVAATTPFLCSPRFSASTSAADAPLIQTPDAASEWRRFEITTHVTLREFPAAQLWLPLAQTAGGYQTVLDLHWQDNGQTERIHDARYGAPILHSVWDGKSGETPQIKVTQIVATRDRKSLPLLPLTEAERAFWTSPSANAPTGDAIPETVRRITAGLMEPRAKLRALYDWVVDHTHRDPDVPGCGTGNTQANLLNGSLGGKCADINGLMINLARAAGFPARDVYGVRVADSKFYPCLGRSGDISKAQHCRAEVFLEEEGWFPIDPADVRKVVLEQKISLDSPAGIALRDHLFGFWEMNWIGYNSATDIQLPGQPASQKPAFSFLMYPHAVTATGLAPCLDPARFQYEITARSQT